MPTKSAAQKIAEAQAKLEAARKAQAEAEAELAQLDEEANAELRSEVDKLLSPLKKTWDQLYAAEIKKMVNAAIKEAARSGGVGTVPTPNQGDGTKSGSGDRGPKVFDWLYKDDPSKGFVGDKPKGPPQPWHHRDANGNVDMTKFRKPTAAEREAMEKKRADYLAKQASRGVVAAPVITDKD